MNGRESAQARLRAAEWRTRAETQTLFAVLGGADGLTRAVGGVVRDTILGRSRDTADIDLATELRPDEVMARADAAGIAVYPTGIEHGTVTLKLGETLAEVTTLRRDIETDGRHAVVAFGTDWAEDAARRDFTLNALYCFDDGRLFDPLDGLGDCLEGQVRFIGDAGERIAEDGLRVFRFFRFAASHGEQRLDADGLAACAIAAGRLSHLSAERVGGEMLRMLALPRVAATLQAMAQIALLDLPDGVLQSLLRYEHTAEVPSAVARLAIMLDEMASDSLQRSWRLSNDVLARAMAIGAAAALLRALRTDEAQYRYHPYLTDALDVATALANWGAAGKSAVAERIGGDGQPALPVNGRDLVERGLEPGPALGRQLALLESAWIESGFALDREALLALLQN